MTREEIDAIYNAQQNSNPVNNAGITRAEIDAVFDSYEKPKKPVNSQKATKASVSSPVPPNEDVIDMNGNIIQKASVKKNEETKRNVKRDTTKKNIEKKKYSEPDKNKLSMKDQFALAGDRKSVV